MTDSERPDDIGLHLRRHIMMTLRPSAVGRLAGHGLWPPPPGRDFQIDDIEGKVVEAVAFMLADGCGMLFITMRCEPRLPTSTAKPPFEVVP